MLDQYERLLHQLHMKPNVTLCGGGPLLAPFIMPLLQKIRERFPDAEVSIQSNGTMITEEIADVFRVHAVVVQMSIDGPDAERHDSIRGKGSFAKSMEGCALLRHSGVPFYFQSVLSKRSERWIEELFQLALQEQARSMHFVRLVPEGHAKDLEITHRDHPLIGGALQKAYTSILASSRQMGIATNTTGPLWHLIEPQLGSPDNTGFASCVIDYQGGFKVTSRTPTVVGNVLQTDMADLFLRHPLMQQLRKNQIAGCGDRPHFMACRGDRNASFALHGHFFGPDTGCWYWPTLASTKDAFTPTPERSLYADMVQTHAAAYAHARAH